ncbi:MAG: hypothetical protein HY675_09130, partial [Chloroflexi bacterium]|nr:hypothetical protein [Chloroflexota bacterium]
MVGAGVLLAVRHPLISDALQSILELNRLSVSGRVSLPEDAVAQAKLLRPQVIILDSQLLTGEDDLVERLQAASPEGRIVILADSDGDGKSTAAPPKGAISLIYKDASADDLMASLRSVLRDEKKRSAAEPAVRDQATRVVTHYSTIVVAALLFAVNIILVLPLFQGGYTQYLGSIESAFITDARFISENGLFATWSPLWYMGFPFHLFYTPLLPYLAALGHSLWPALSVASSYRMVSALLYALGPSTLYVFALYLTRRRLTAVICAAGYSVLPSVVYLIPGIRSDATSFGWAPWQLVVMVKYGEGPHINSLTFTPLAAMFFLHALRRPSMLSYLLAGLAIAAVALINWIGLFALVVILAILLLSEALAGQTLTKVGRAFWCAVAAFTLAAFWYNLSFIRASLAFGGGGGMLPGAPYAIIGGIILVYVLFILLANKPNLQVEIVVGLWLFYFGAVVLAGQYLGLTLAPQPIRYVPELSMGVLLALALGLTRLHDWPCRRLPPWARKAAAPTFGGLVLVGFALVSQPFFRDGWSQMLPSGNFRSSSEYRVAQWLAANGGGELAYVTGSHSFWLNVETDVPQVRGGTDQGATNPWWGHVSYQINTDKDADISHMWLRALGIRWVVVNYPESTDTYKDYVFPHKFDGLLTRRYLDRGTAIFEVPLAKPSLAQVVNARQMKELKPPFNAIDRVNLAWYVEAIEAPQGGSVSYRRTGIDRMEIEVEAEAGQSLLVRTTYDGAWQAFVDNQSAKISPDVLGFMVVEMPIAGSHKVRLEHGRAFDVWLGYGVSVLTLLFLVWYPLRSLFGFSTEHQAGTGGYRTLDGRSVVRIDPTRDERYSVRLDSVKARGPTILNKPTMRRPGIPLPPALERHPAGAVEEPPQRPMVVADRPKAEGARYEVDQQAEQQTREAVEQATRGESKPRIRERQVRKAFWSVRASALFAKAPHVPRHLADLAPVVRLSTVVFSTLAAMGVSLAAFVPLAQVYLNTYPPAGGDFFHGVTNLAILRQHPGVWVGLWNQWWFSGHPYLRQYGVLSSYLALPFAERLGDGPGLLMFLVVAMGLFVLFTCLLLKELSGRWLVAVPLTILVTWSAGLHQPLAAEGLTAQGTAQMFFPLCLFFLARHVRTGSQRSLVAGGLSNGIAFLAHPIVGGMIMGIFVIILLFAGDERGRKFDSRGFKNLFVYGFTTALVGGVVAVPLIATVMHYSQAASTGAARVFYEPRMLMDIFLITNPALIALLVAVLGYRMVQKLRHRGDNLLDGAFLDRQLMGLAAATAVLLFLQVLFAFGINPARTSVTASRTWFMGHVLFASVVAVVFRQIRLHGERRASTEHRWRIGLPSAITGLILLGGFIGPSLGWSRVEATFVKTWLSPMRAIDVLMKRNDLANSPLLPSWMDGNATDQRVWMLDPRLSMWWTSLYQMPETVGYFDPAYKPWVDWRVLMNMAVNGNLTKQPRYTTAAAKNVAKVLVDWFAIRYFVTTPGADEDVPVADYLLNDRTMVERSEMYGGLKVTRLLPEAAGPIVVATKAPTVLVIGDDVGYETLVRAISLAGLGPKRLIPVRGPKQIDDVSPEELSRFTAVALYNYGSSDSAKAFGMIEEYVRRGGGLFVDTGSLAPESEQANLPRVFPITRTRRAPLGTEWDLTTSATAELGEIDASSFSPPRYGSSAWALSYVPQEQDVRSWARMILAQGGRPIMAAGTLGKGRVVWSGMNLPYHVTDYVNLSEATVLANVISWIAPQPEAKTPPNYQVSRRNPESLTVTGSGFTGVLFKENAFEGWSARVSTEEGSTGAKIYWAGPDLIYVPVSGLDESKGISVQFSYSGRLQDWALLLASILAIFVSLDYASSGWAVSRGILRGSRAVAHWGQRISRQENRLAVRRTIIRRATKTKVVALVWEVLAPVIVVALSAYLARDMFRTERLDSGDFIYHAYRIRSLLEYGFLAWTNDWGGGFPLWQSYQFIPHVATLILKWLTPWSVTKAMVFASGIVFVGLRLLVYIGLRLARFSATASIIGALLTLAITGYYGPGRLPSPIGDFSLQWGVALFPAVIFLLAGRKKATWRVYLAALVIGLGINVHPIFAVVGGIVLACFLVVNRDLSWRETLYTLAVMGLASSFYWMPTLFGDKPAATMATALVYDLKRQDFHLPWLGLSPTLIVAAMVALAIA